MRKSSLVEEDSAENSPRIKRTTEDRVPRSLRAKWEVGERSNCSEVLPQGQDGAIGSENAGMSSESEVRILTAECLRFPV